MKRNFMLKNQTAEKLYECIKDLPIIDYHCHLDARQILQNNPLDNISALWLGGDHYKWRLMRMGGVEESYITGQKSDYEKFQKYIEVLSYAIGSPLYHWSKLELEKYFGVEEEILPQNARLIYDKANESIAASRLTPQKILRLSNVEKMCVVEDAETFDSSVYDELKKSGLSTEVTPLMRTDKLLCRSLQEIKRTAGKIMEKFVKAGCKCADFGAEYLDESDDDSIEKFSYLLNECYNSGMVVQLHFGAMRNVNGSMFDALGADAGFDSISEKPYLSGLKKALDKVDNVGKTIVFNLNPADNAKIATFTCNFAGGGVRGKMQTGVAWWFNDHKNGINRFFDDISSMAMLAVSAGMLTDSRSLLSYVRHDYFRRLLCSYVGGAAESGEFASQWEILEKIVCDVAYNNVKQLLA